MNPRRQLTLFIPMPARECIERVREAMEPLQFAKIGAHITLCYDDELRDWERVNAGLDAIASEAIEFSFSVQGPRVFEAEGKGIYLSTIDRNGFYETSRRQILGKSPWARKQVGPHITLLHPRHARSAEHGWDWLKTETWPDVISVHNIALIEYRDGRWETVRKIEEIGSFPRP